MVQFGVPTVESAMALGREAADYISGTFIKVSILPIFRFKVGASTDVIHFDIRNPCLFLEPTKTMMYA